MLLAKQKFPIMGFITICFLTASSSLPATIINNTKCPVEPTELAVSKYKSNYKGNTIYFCCKDCVSIFNNKAPNKVKNNWNLPKIINTLLLSSLYGFAAMCNPNPKKVINIPTKICETVPGAM